VTGFLVPVTRFFQATENPVIPQPEQTDLKIGFLPLVDCAPLVVAQEKGFFQKQGLRVQLEKMPSWTSARDALDANHHQAAHMMLSMPLAGALGRLGTNQKPLIAPWILNRNGQAISLNLRHRAAYSGNPSDLYQTAVQAREAGRPLVFGITLPPGTHAMWLRYFLASGGIHPDRDVALITIAPPQMVANMRMGRMDGFSVGEPWNAVAITQKLGFTAQVSSQLWPDHPDKVCAFTEEFAEKNPQTVLCVLKALHEAGIWLDHHDHRSELALLLARGEYLNVSADQLLPRLEGSYELGQDSSPIDLAPVLFSARGCNCPQPKYATWFLTQFRRWGMIDQAPDYQALSWRVMRPDLYQEALKQAGVEPEPLNQMPETLFDGISFNPADAEAYATGFAIHNIKT
jgi:nitrate/nitrite transport system substrate-binding protein